MKTINLALSLSIALLIISSSGFAQSYNKTSYFSALQGQSSKVDSLIVPAVSSQDLNVKISGEKAGDFKHLSTTQGSGENSPDAIVKYRYEPPMGYRGISRATLEVKNKSKKVANIDLRGMSMPALEGENEATLAQILSIMDITTDLGWSTLANHIRPEMQGEEINAGLFQKASDGPVSITPIARYSPPFIVPFGYYLPSSDGPLLKQVGILADSKKFHEHQTLYPSVSEGSTSFDPQDKAFGLYVVSPSHNSFTEDTWNHLNYPTRAGHAARIFPVKDKNGDMVENSLLVCFEEAGNGDYQDYMFLVENIQPVDPNSLFESLLQPNSLDGWEVWLQTQEGINNDPENIFSVKNGILTDIGKDLGYIITEKSYDNYHFRLQFKWGEKKWPPRDAAKRDSGICYHIPEDEENTIWPQSVECQIQEGDVGDFWLLGYSTIEVDGKQNEPYKHSQIVKAKDNELPNGEWNTVEVLTVDGICVHLVNGVVVNYGTNSSLRKGRILLQSEYAELYYRNVEIRSF